MMRINDSISSISSVLNDWRGFLVNSRFARQGNIISWASHEKIFFDEPLTAENVRVLVEKHQYSFQYIEDGGIFQLYYEFSRDGSTVTDASLGYYKINKYGNSEGFDVEDDLGIIAEDEAPAINNANEVTWLRLDYQPSSARGIAHSRCHLHIGGFKGSRLVVYGVPSPKQFVEFVFALCYPDVFEKHRLNQSGQYRDNQVPSRINNPVIDALQDKSCEAIIHLRIPSVP